MVFASANGVTKAGLARRRIARSCVECQRAKAKCSGQSQCARCDRKAVACLYREPGENASPSPDAAPSAWLLSSTLPPTPQLRDLLDKFFTNVHTVRCLGFLHIPTFMERFQETQDSDPSGLVHVMCALAAPFCLAQATAASEDSMAGLRLHEAGRRWATVAMERIFANFGSLAIEGLMAAVLLHEYHLRAGDHAKALLLSGLVTRHVQILQLNVEYDQDILSQREGAASWAVKESHRRLFWACYLQDAFIECGIDQLRLISASDIHIQLPCLDDYFIRDKPCVTEMLTPGTALPFLDATQNDSASHSASLDLRAYYIRVMTARSRVLNYIKNLRDDIPWRTSGNSRFQQLDEELRSIEASIPDEFTHGPGNTYLYKASGRLNVYFGVHILLAQTFNDLYRVGVAGLVFPPSATQLIRDTAPTNFITECHRVCATKAVYIATLLRDLYNCHKDSLVDTPYAMHAQVCSSVLVTTLASWESPEPLLPQMAWLDYSRLLDSNVRVLRHLRRYIKVDIFLDSAVQARKRFDRMGEHYAAQCTPQGENGEMPNPRQFSLDYVLNPLGVYPIARAQARDRHRPEQFPTAAHMVDESAVVEDVVEDAYTWDWSQVPFLESLGYPTFLEDAFPDSVQSAAANG